MNTAASQAPEDAALPSHDSEKPLGHFRPLPGQASQAFVWPQVPYRLADTQRRRSATAPHPSRSGDPS